MICPDFDDLLPAVSSLLADPARRRAIGERGRVYARRFDLHTFARRWRRLVRSLADQPSAPG